MSRTVVAEAVMSRTSTAQWVTPPVVKRYTVVWEAQCRVVSGSQYVAGEITT